MKKKGIALLIILLLGFTCFLAACTPKEFTFKLVFYSDTEGTIVYEELPATNSGFSEPETPPVKEGYDFGGWFTDKYAEEALSKFPYETNARTEIPVYPKWMKSGSKGIVYDLLANGTYQVSGIGSFSGAELVIPETYEGRAVSIIASGAFKDCKQLERVTLPVTLVQIRSEAFKGCDGIRTMVLPSGTNLVYIGEDAFADCDNVIFYTSSSDNNSNITSGWGNWNKLNRPVYYDVKAVYEQEDFEYIVTNNVISAPDDNNNNGEGENTENPEGTNPSDNEVPESDYQVYITRYIGHNAEFNMTLEYYSHEGMLTIGDNATLHIGEYAFDDCDVNIVFPAGGLAQLDDYAFAGYKGEHIDIPDVTALGQNVFYDTAATFDIEKIGLTSLGDYFFAGYKGETITIPATVIRMGQYVFADSTAEIVFAEGNNITRLGVYSMANYNGEEFVVPSQITEIDRFAFMNCTADVSLANVTLKDNKLARHAFINYAGKNITLPSTLTSIEERAFYNSAALESIVIPDSVTEIGDDAFYGCDSLYEITVGSANTAFKSDEYGVLYSKNGDTLIVHPAAEDKQTAFEIPQEVKKIAPNAFRNSTLLTSVTLPDGLTEIGENAFENCRGMEFILIPSTVKTMGANVFKGCSSLRIAIEGDMPSGWNTGFNPDNCEVEVNSEGILEDKENGFEYLVVSDGVMLLSYTGEETQLNLTAYEGHDLVAIGPRAFEGKDITSITLPDTVTSIGAYAFNNSKLETITASSVTSVGAYAFANTAVSEINMPKLNTIADHAFYQSALTNITFGTEITKLEDYVFAGTELTSYTVPANITTLGSNVFANTPLTSIIIPNTVTEIGSNIMNGCKNVTHIEIGFIGETIKSTNSKINNYLFGSSDVSNYELILTGAIESISFTPLSNTRTVTKITLPATVTKIEANAFEECSALQTIVFLGTVTDIQVAAFRNCVSLETIDLSNVQYIGENAFSGCALLNNITLTNNLKPTQSGNPLNTGSFANCKALSTITIPNTITEIPESCFSGCESLTAITFEGNLSKIGAYAFDGCSSLNTLDIRLNVESSSNTPLAANAFTGCYGNVTVTIASGSLPALPNNSFNGFCGTTVTLDGKFTEIGSYAFQNSENLTTVTATGVTAINDNAFSGCLSLLTFDMSKVTVLGEYVFQNCQSLDNIVLNNSLASKTVNSDGAQVTTQGALPRYTFSGCSSLKTINPGTGITSIGIWAFNKCYSLRSFDISHITQIGDYAFVDCTNLKELHLNRNIKLGGYAFRGCTKLVVWVDGMTKAEAQSPSVWGDSRLWEQGARFKFSDSDNNAVYVDTTNGAVYESKKKGNDEYYVLVAYVGDGSLNIPANVNGKPVREIGANAFTNLTGLTQVTLASSITTIGDSAFAGCTDLTAITASGVTELGTAVFSGCTSLTNVKLGVLSKLPAQTFENCTALETLSLKIAAGAANSETGENTSLFLIERDAFANTHAAITFDKNIVMLGEYAMRNYKGESFDLSSIANIGRYAFSGATAKLIMNDNEDEIPDYAFAGYAGTEITLSTSLKKIGASAFANCLNLPSITIPASVDTIGAKAFENLTVSVTFDDQTKIREITAGAFSGYLGENISIPASVTAIGASAFENAKNFVSVTIPSTVTEIKDGAFSGCSKLTSVQIEGNITNLGNMIFVNCVMLSEVKIQGTFTEIGEMTFYNCRSLTDFEIPASVSVIGESAFYACSSLKDIKLPTNLKEIHDEAFAMCSGVAVINIPASVDVIGERVFVGCSILSEIKVDGSNTAYCDVDGILFNAAKTELICYPSAKDGETYEVLDSVNRIHAYAFESSKLTAVYIYDNVKTIDAYAFFDCVDLVISCSHASKPSGFANNWNYCLNNSNGTDYCSVVWAYVKKD